MSTSLPLYADATLIPFAGKIVYDSLMVPYNIHFGSGIRRNLNNDYRNLKSVYGFNSLKRGNSQAGWSVLHFDEIMNSSSFAACNDLYLEKRYDGRRYGMNLLKG
jgi:hypothetical protein